MTRIFIYYIEQNINLFLIFKLVISKQSLMKQQAKMLFYIGKQIKCSNKIQEIISGLQKSRAFIREVSTLEFLNTLIMSLINLFSETNYSYIRKQVAEILLQSSGFIAQLPSRPEIVSSLTQKLKSNDLLVRILTLSIIEGLHSLFHRDTSVYHSLLSRLKWKKEFSQKQSLMIIRALRSLLQNSQFLAEVFHNNIKQLSQLGQIEVKIIAYLCVFAKFEAKSYESVVTTLWELCTQKKMNNNKRIKHYFSKLLIKACRINYFCIQLYLKNYCNVVPQLLKRINKIQYESFNFLEERTNFDKDQSHREILDFYYQYYNIETELSSEVNQFISNKVIQDINNNALTHYSVLLTFYLTRQTREINQFDQIFTQRLNTFHFGSLNQPQYYKKLLKIALVTANYRLSYRILQHLLNTCLSASQLSPLMLFTCYVEWRLEPTADKFYTFLSVMENLSEACVNWRQAKLIELGQLWKSQYKNIQQGNEEISKISQDWEPKQESMQDQKKDIRLKNNCQIKCEQQIKCVKQSKLIMAPIKNRNQKYNKIYFTKRTVIDIFRFL